MNAIDKLLEEMGFLSGLCCDSLKANIAMIQYGRDYYNPDAFEEWIPIVEAATGKSWKWIEKRLEDIKNEL